MGYREHMSNNNITCLVCSAVIGTIQDLCFVTEFNEKHLCIKPALLRSKWEMTTKIVSPDGDYLRVLTLT